MIYQFLRERLESVEALGGKIFPTGVCIDDVDTPLVVYTYKDRIPVRDLSGEVHHYTEDITLDFLSEIYDDLHELYHQAEAALAVSNYDTGNGEYIFSATCTSPEPDRFDPDTGLHRRTMQVALSWCPV